MSRSPLEMKLYSMELEQTALIDFYIVDLTPMGGEQLRFHSGKNQLLADVIWQGNTYGAYPVQASGFELNGQGTSNRPTLTFANIFGTLTGLNQAYEDLVGVKVTRKQVYAKYLDAVNFTRGNPTANPTQEIVSRFVVEQMKTLEDTIASYTLSLPCETDGAIIPARIVTVDVCQWQYRSSECSYSGGPVADELNKPTSDPAKDKCSKSLTGCKLRFGANGILPYGGFPSAQKY